MKNKVKGIFKVVMSLLVSILMLVGISAGNAMAVGQDGDGAINSMIMLVKGDSSLAQYAQTISTAVRNDSDVKANFNLLYYSYDNGTMEFDNANYNKLELKAKRQAMKIALDAIGSSNLSSTVKMKFYNFVADQDSGVSQAIRTLSSDASADVAGAMGWLAPYYGVFATIWGLICILIFIIMAFSTTIDLVYLVVPVARSLMTDKKTGRPWCVSVEAYNAIKKDEDSGGKDNYMGIYLRTRFIAFLVIGTILTMIVTGTIWDPFLYFGSEFTGRGY